MKTSLLCLLFGFSLSLFALEDTLPKGAFRFSLSYASFDADQYLNNDEVAVPARLGLADADYSEDVTRVEFQYGIDRFMTWVVTSEHVSRELTTEGSGISNSGYTGGYMGLRQRLTGLNNSTHLIAETGVWVPASYDANRALPLGSGGVNWYLITSYGQEFFPTPGSFQMDFGYVFRNEGPEDEYFFKGRLDFELFRSLTTGIKFETVESKDNNGVDYSNLDYPKDRGRQTLGLEIQGDLSRKWSFKLAYQQMVSGRNQFDTSGYSLTVGWRPR